LRRHRTPAPESFDRLADYPANGGAIVPADGMPTDLEDAWSDLHDAKPPGWHVGQPSWDDRRKIWEQYAFDPRERAVVGHRWREWTATAPTEPGVVRELARCLRLIREDRVPQ
jgi:hypothetical protein